MDLVQGENEGENRSARTASALVRAGFDAFYILEPVRGEADLIVDFVCAELNVRAAEWLQRPREQVLGKRMTDLFPAEEIAPMIARYAKVLQTHEAFEEEAPTALTGSSSTWLRRQVFQFGDAVVVTTRDISEQKGEEFALRRSHELLEQRVAERTAALTQANAELKAQVEQTRRAEQRFTQLFEGGQLAISIADLSGKAIEVNEAFASLVGYTRGELLAPGFDSTGLIVRESEERRALTRAELISRGVSPPRERQFIRKDGTRVPALMTITAMRPNEVMVCVVDLTETNKVQAALRHTEEQLRQSQKMDAIGRLAGGIAHDFNNLLSVILGYGEMIQLGLDESNPMYADLAEIVAAGRRAAELTKQLLAYSRKQILQPRVLNVNGLLIGLERMLRRLIGENIEFTVLPSPDLGLVKIDPGQVEQAVMNLVVNARDAMPSGGKLTIETANVELDAEYAREHPDVVPGRHVMIAVSDNGAGMDAATRARVFEPFFTTKGLGKGTGLGLSTVFGIINQSGGHVWVDSEPGAGTTFKVYLPFAEAAEAEAALPREVASFQGTETLLLVEDDEQVRTLAHSLLRRHGYHVLEAQSGGDALLICEQYSERIDLLITDVVMPRITGRQLALRLRELRAEMKVLYMSGYTDNSIAHHGVLDSGIHFLEKPITVDSLARKVREVLDATR